MTSPLAAPGHEDRLNAILLAYVEACEAGKEPDREELLRTHPEWRDELALFFVERDRLERLGGIVRHHEDSSGEAFRGRSERSVRAASAGDGSPQAGEEKGRLGDFRILREIGRGGMGVVYEAEQISLGRRVALKVLPFAAALDPRQLQRFKNEASAAAHLRHENIVPVHAIGCERGVHYYAMQFIEGQSLSAYLAQTRQALPSPPDSTTLATAWLTTEGRSNRTSHWDWIATLGKQAAAALEQAHQSGVIHRDIKPGNLLLDTRGQLWIADFGLAQFSSDAGLTVTGELLGTLRYASPEQILGRRGVVNHQSDLYSLGATLYELLTLRPPFDGRDRHALLRQIAEEVPPAPRSVVPDVPPPLETIVMKALRKDPADRYKTAQEMAEDLQRFLERRPILAKPMTVAEQFWSWVRRHPTLSLVSASCLILIAVCSMLIAILVGAGRERTLVEQRRVEEAYRAEQLRAEEAESRLLLARRAVDELLRLSEEELADRPELVLLRKQVLRSALSFYEEFLSERRHDPLRRAELLATTDRVEQILADLEILRTATRSYLLCQPHVLEDLGVTEAQRPEIADWTAQVGREWAESFRDIGLISPAKRARRTLERARANDSKLNALLTPWQQQRLRQLGLQAEGAAAFRDQEVAMAIGLTPSQSEQIRLIEEDTTHGWLRRDHRHHAMWARDGRDGEYHRRSIHERILEVLTEEQKRKWEKMIGEPLQGTLFPNFVPRTAYPANP